jgi:hypothetical protein
MPHVSVSYVTHTYTNSRFLATHWQAIERPDDGGAAGAVNATLRLETSTVVDLSQMVLASAMASIEE